VVDTAFWLSLLSIIVTLSLGLLVFINNRRANSTAEKKLTVEEKQAAYEREAVITRRRGEELDRLYTRCDELEADIKQLIADRKEDLKQIKILGNRAELADAREALLYRHTRELRDHIVNQLPPPPPTLPIDLIEWFAQFEMTDPDARA
jgi:hypothetical protein